MILKFLIAASVFLAIAGCAPKSDIDAANSKIAVLQSNIDVANGKVTALQAQVQALMEENAKLKASLAIKPNLPVTLNFRKAMMGPGYVAVFNTTVKAPISVLATLKSAALGTKRQFELRLNPSSATELGHLEGATIELGDTITLENNNYSSVTFTANP